VGDLDLVRAQVDAAGAGPGNGATADGIAEEGGRSKHFSPQRSLRNTKEEEKNKMLETKKKKGATKSVRSKKE